MFKDQYKNDKDYGVSGYLPLSPMADLSPDRNILAYNPYVQNQTVKPFFDDSKEQQIPTIQKRTSSPQPGQRYPPTVIKYVKAFQQEPIKKVQKVWSQNQNISLQQKDKIMTSLRDHFDQVLRNLSQQMNFQLRRRDDEIKKLQKKLKDNEIETQNKQKQIIKLKQQQLNNINQNLHKINNEKFDKISLKNKPIQELQRNFQYLTGKIRDIDLKIKIIIESYSQSAKQAKVLTRMEERVNILLDEFIKIQTKKIYGLNLRMFQFFSSKDSLLVALERQVQAGKQTLQSDGCPSKVNMTVYEQKLNGMKRQLQGLQKTIQYISQKQLKNHLQPGRLQRVQKEILRLQQKNKIYQSSFSSKQQILQEYAHQYKIILSRINKLYGQMEYRRNQGQPNQRVIGQLKTTPRKQNKQQIKPLRQKKISAPQISNVLFYSTHDSTSDTQYFQNSDDDGSKSKMNDKLLDLIEIIRTNRKNMPLKCVVDQHGYLKERETGAYLFDRNGVLFELQQDELHDAVRRRIVSV